MGETRRRYVEAFRSTVTGEGATRRGIEFALALCVVYAVGIAAFSSAGVELSPSQIAFLATVGALAFELVRPVVFALAVAVAVHVLSWPSATKGDFSTTVVHLSWGFVPVFLLGVAELGYYLSPLHSPGDRGLEAMTRYLRAPAAESSLLAVGAAVALFFAIFAWIFGATRARGISVARSAVIVGVAVSGLLLVGFP
ncbi:hypothetical protein [Halegenticoccus tardaugens]|uniref:hypothetical protein n=1 Tax=Halegenticoccus tardaugens TaxID=2071624 RepID=UPI00100B9057|nr:hypothetical protein [Halegenticoccus tardaugens]